MDPPVQAPPLSSPQLQEEFFKERQRRFCDDHSDDSSPSAPLSPASSSPGLSPRSSPNPGSISGLSSPALLAEMKSRPLSLKPVPRTTGLTRVFSGRGSDRRPATNQEPPQ
ncbi:espin-like [Periophthalmus magnuspinnatus]|uniref:espin-like n=1 Tax=Periophthalmus magnuspinnatus TaxID=409849 RepID=UPI00145A22C6|nr:espin-like [Periophthalmus magnuspinnatus]